MRRKAQIIWEEISVYVYISIGLIIYGTGVTLFMIPYQITSGGVTGISSLIFYATGTIEVQVSYLTINAFLLIAAVKILGWKFCLKTIYGVLFLSIQCSPIKVPYDCINIFFILVIIKFVVSFLGFFLLFRLFLFL